MNPYNPYEAPNASDGRIGGNFGSGEPAGSVIQEALLRTRPWVKFLAVMGFLGSAIIGLFSLIFMAGGAGMSRAFGGGGAAVTVIGGLIYLGVAGLYFVASVLLWRFGAAIDDYSREGATVSALVNPIQRQASFWRYVGILTAIGVALNILLFFFIILAGLGAATMR